MVAGPQFNKMITLKSFRKVKRYYGVKIYIMSQVSEIKCPNCGKWSQWTGKIEATCPHCGAHLEPGRMHYAEEQKIIRERNRNDGFMAIKKDDDPVVRLFKEFVSWLRWTTFYGISVIYIVIAVMVILYGLVML